MKKNTKWIRSLAILLTATMLATQTGPVTAAAAKSQTETTTDSAVAPAKKGTKSQKPDTRSLKSSADISSATILEADVTSASTGCTMFGIYGSYYSNAQEALDKINEIRKEACEAGNIPDPRNLERMLTPSDYKPLKWSRDLESVARLRAAEAGISFRFMDSGHDRPSDKYTFSISYNNISSSCEDLAYYLITDMVEGVLLWKSEKNDWVNQNLANETGHYTSMINPDYNYVGLGDFYSDAAPYPNTLAGEFSKKTGLDETMQDAPTNVIQKVEINNDYIQDYYLDGADAVNTDQHATLTPMVTLQRTFKGNPSIRHIWSIDDVTFSSSDPTIATVDQHGTVTGLTHGTATITAKTSDTIQATKEISIICAHNRTLAAYTPATCTSTGSKTFHCDVCGKDFDEMIPKLPHDYVYGDTDSDGKSTGICSVCNDTIHITPITSFSLHWKSSIATDGYYWSSFPAVNPVGSTISCWLNSQDGEEGYRDIRITSSDPTVLAVPDTLDEGISSNNIIKVLSPGITTLTAYPVYNVRLKQTFVIRIGDAGSVTIAPAELTLSQNSYTYDGTAHTPEVTVDYRGTTLKEGVDYTLSYANNTTVGTAQAIIKGTGIFTGTTQIDFTIRKATDDAHTHTIVTDDAVAPTCTKPGLTEGSHCSVCGEVITAQTEIPATGHHYENGQCTTCGDFLYVDKDGIRYTPQTDVYGNIYATTSAVPNTTLSGGIRIPATITIGDTKCNVTCIGANTFANQTEITSITLPKTITSIESGAFRGCSNLHIIYFQCQSAPTAAEDAWEGAGASTDGLIFSVPLSGGGFDAMAEPAGATVERKQTIPNHVHDLVKHDAVAATCEETGNIAYYTCEDCGKVFINADGTGEIGINDVTTYPIGHTWNTYFTIDTPATATTPGQKSIHCSRCNARRDVTTIPAGSSADDNDTDDDNDDFGGNHENDIDTFLPSQPQPSSSSYVKAGTTITVGNLRYKVVTANNSKKQYTVKCLGFAKKASTKKITKLTIPNRVKYKNVSYTVTAINNKAFYKNKALTTVATGRNVTTLGAKAFYGCTSLKKVTIQKKTKKIGAQTFAKCSKLRTVTIRTTLLTKKSVGKNVFRGIHKKAKFKFPASKKSAYRKFIR